MLVLSFDYGGVRDPAAACGLETAGRNHAVRFLDRWYGDFASRAAAIANRLKPAAVVMDASGPQGRRGLAELLPLVSVPVFGICAVSNDRPPGQSRQLIYVPKKSLVMALTRAVEQHRLQIASLLPLAGQLAQELQSYRQKERGGVTIYEHARRSIHDDLVSALQLAIWFSETQSARGTAAAWRPAQCSPIM